MPRVGQSVVPRPLERSPNRHPRVEDRHVPSVFHSPKCIGIVGSRRRNTANDMVGCLVAFDSVWEEGDTLVSGGCPIGGDSFAESIAKARGLTITVHFPDWTKYGKAAGPIRNTKIAQQCDVLIALAHEDRTGGTEDTIRKALKLGKRVIYA